MEIFILPFTLANLLVSFQFPTTFRFEHPIEYFSLGKQGSFHTYVSKNKKLLIITPKIREFNLPLVVITERGTYRIKLTSSIKEVSNLYLIKKGMRDKKYILKKESPKYRLLEGEHSLYLEIKKGPLIINDKNHSGTSVVLSKGPLLTIDGIREN